MVFWARGEEHSRHIPHKPGTNVWDPGGSLIAGPHWLDKWYPPQQQSNLNLLNCRRKDIRRKSPTERSKDPGKGSVMNNTGQEHQQIYSITSPYHFDYDAHQFARDGEDRSSVLLLDRITENNSKLDAGRDRANRQKPAKKGENLETGGVTPRDPTLPSPRNVEGALASPFYDRDFWVPRRPLAPGRVYHFHVIYNNAQSGLGRSHDTDLAFRVTASLVEKLELRGYVNGYYSDRDRRSGHILSEELERVISGSSLTILLLTPGFLRDCLNRYLQISAFRELLTQHSSTTGRLVIIGVGVTQATLPLVLGKHEVLFFKEEDWETDHPAWSKLDHRLLTTLGEKQKHISLHPQEPKLVLPADHETTKMDQGHNVYECALNKIVEINKKVTDLQHQNFTSLEMMHTRVPRWNEEKGRKHATDCLAGEINKDAFQENRETTARKLFKDDDTWSSKPNRLSVDTSARKNGARPNGRKSEKRPSYTPNDQAAKAVETVNTLDPPRRNTESVFGKYFRLTENLLIADDFHAMGMEHAAWDPGGGDKEKRSPSLRYTSCASPGVLADDSDSSDSSDAESDVTVLDNSLETYGLEHWRKSYGLEDSIDVVFEDQSLDDTLDSVHTLDTVELTQMRERYGFEDLEDATPRSESSVDTLNTADLEELRARYGFNRLDHIVGEYSTYGDDQLYDDLDEELVWYSRSLDEDNIDDDIRMLSACTDIRDNRELIYSQFPQSLMNEGHGKEEATLEDLNVANSQAPQNTRYETRLETDHQHFMFRQGNEHMVSPWLLWQSENSLEEQDLFNIKTECKGEQESSSVKGMPTIEELWTKWVDFDIEDEGTCENVETVENVKDLRTKRDNVSSGPFLSGESKTNNSGNKSNESKNANEIEANENTHNLFIQTTLTQSFEGNHLRKDKNKMAQEDSHNTLDSPHDIVKIASSHIIPRLNVIETDPIEQTTSVKERTSCDSNSEYLLHLPDHERSRCLEALNEAIKDAVISVVGSTPRDKESAAPHDQEAVSAPLERISSIKIERDRSQSRGQSIDQSCDPYSVINHLLKTEIFREQEPAGSRGEMDFTHDEDQDGIRGNAIICKTNAASRADKDNVIVLGQHSDLSLSQHAGEIEISQQACKINLKVTQNDKELGEKRNVTTEGRESCVSLIQHNFGWKNGSQEKVLERPTVDEESLISEAIKKQDAGKISFDSKETHPHNLGSNLNSDQDLIAKEPKVDTKAQYSYFKEKPVCPNAEVKDMSVITVTGCSKELKEKTKPVVEVGNTREEDSNAPSAKASNENFGIDRDKEKTILQNVPINYQDGATLLKGEHVESAHGMKIDKMETNFDKMHEDKILHGTSITFVEVEKSSAPRFLEERQQQIQPEQRYADTALQSRDTGFKITTAAEKNFSVTTRPTNSIPDSSKTSSSNSKGNVTLGPLSNERSEVTSCLLTLKSGELNSAESSQRLNIVALNMAHEILTHMVMDKGLDKKTKAIKATQTTSIKEISHIKANKESEIVESEEISLAVTDSDTRSSNNQSSEANSLVGPFSNILESEAEEITSASQRNSVALPEVENISERNDIETSTLSVTKEDIFDITQKCTESERKQQPSLECSLNLSNSQNACASEFDKKFTCSPNIDTFTLVPNSYCLPRQSLTDNKQEEPMLKITTFEKGTHEMQTNKDSLVSENFTKRSTFQTSDQTRNEIFSERITDEESRLSEDTYHVTSTGSLCEMMPTLNKTETQISNDESRCLDDEPDGQSSSQDEVGQKCEIGDTTSTDCRYRISNIKQIRFIAKAIVQGVLLSSLNRLHVSTTEKADAHDDATIITSADTKDMVDETVALSPSYSTLGESFDEQVSGLSSSDTTTANEISLLYRGLQQTPSTLYTQTYPQDSCKESCDDQLGLELDADNSFSDIQFVHASSPRLSPKPESDSSFTATSNISFISDILSSYKGTEHDFASQPFSDIHSEENKTESFDVLERQCQENAVIEDGFRRLPNDMDSGFALQSNNTHRNLETSGFNNRGSLSPRHHPYNEGDSGFFDPCDSIVLSKDEAQAYFGQRSKSSSSHAVENCEEISNTKRPESRFRTTDINLTIVEESGVIQQASGGISVSNECELTDQSLGLFLQPQPDTVNENSDMSSSKATVTESEKISGEYNLPTPDSLERLALVTEKEEYAKASSREAGFKERNSSSSEAESFHSFRLESVLKNFSTREDLIAQAAQAEFRSASLTADDYDMFYRGVVSSLDLSAELQHARTSGHNALSLSSTERLNLDLQQPGVLSTRLLTAHLTPRLTSRMMPRTRSNFERLRAMHRRIQGLNLEGLRPLEAANAIRVESKDMDLEGSEKTPPTKAESGATASQTKESERQGESGQQTNWLLQMYKGVCHSIAKPDMPYMG